jgi:hypothetical protein
MFTSTSKLIAVALLAAPLWAVTNSLTITEKGGVTTANYPVQFGRPFAQGEIAACPRPIINGTPATAWQADVKNRWTVDSTAQYAVVAFLIPSLAANSTVTITFDSQTCANTALTQGAMQTDANFAFDATIALTNGTTVTASARTMLDAGSYTAWTSGQVAQTIILADHSNTTTCNGHPCSAYDMGLSTYAADNPFRPIFHATFWPIINKVKLRYIGEIAQTEALADQTYSVALTAGKASPTTVYTQTSFTHGAGQRWTVSTNNQSGQTWTVSTPGGNITVPKDIWIGGTPAPIQINHNLAYLASTKAVYNYDYSITVPESVIGTRYTSWIGNTPSNTVIGGGYNAACGSSGLCGGMGTPGGRWDIGPFDGWSALWLFTFDLRSQRMSMRNAELAAAWPLHWREGKTAKKITRTTALGCTYQCDVSGVGLPMSVTSRPTIYSPSSGSMANFAYSATVAGDKVTPISAATNTIWKYEQDHLQQYTIVPYLLTGDFWYLEEQQFWAAQSVANGYKAPSSRWPNGYELNVKNGHSPRNFAWNLVARAHAAYFSPDNTPVKSYFEVGMKDAMAFAEGWHNVTGSTLYNDPYFRTAWNAGKTSNSDINYSVEGPPPSYHPWDNGSLQLCDDPGLDCTNVYNVMSPWMVNYTIVALGRAAELGYASDALLDYISVWLNGAITNPDYNPWLIGHYRAASLTISTPRTWQATSFSALRSVYLPAHANATSWPQGYANYDSYAAYAFAASSFTSTRADGAAAWTWLKANAYDVIDWTVNPFWAILPRAAVTPPTPTAPTILDSSPLPTGSVATAYLYLFQASGYPVPTWAATGLPSWATVNSATGVLSGSPDVTGTTIIHVTATNGSGSATGDYSLTTNPAPAPAIITTEVLLPGGVGLAYSQTVMATGDSPITWSVTSGALPTWATLNTSTGAITGTPLEAGTATFTIRAANSAGNFDKVFTLSIVVVGRTTTLSGLPMHGVGIR